jgi:hypothetical protein
MFSPQKIRPTDDGQYIVITVNCNPFVHTACDTGWRLPAEVLKSQSNVQGLRSSPFSDYGVVVFLRYIASCSIGIATSAR